MAELWRPALARLGPLPLARGSGGLGRRLRTLAPVSLQLQQVAHPQGLQL